MKIWLDLELTTKVCQKGKILIPIEYNKGDTEATINEKIDKMKASLLADDEFMHVESINSSCSIKNIYMNDDTMGEDQPHIGYNVSLSKLNEILSNN